VKKLRNWIPACAGMTKRLWDWAHTNDGDYVVSFIMFAVSIVLIYVTLFWIL
jgi:hypothetical protein